jgi:hypothetical protein
MKIKIDVTESTLDLAMTPYRAIYAIVKRSRVVNRRTLLLSGENTFSSFDDLRKLSESIGSSVRCSICTISQRLTFVFKP